MEWSKHARSFRNIPTFCLRIPTSPIPGFPAAPRVEGAGGSKNLVSLMVRLHCERFWERLLIPAFVFFFQKLFPFPAVNDDRSAIAAAAGGVMLVRRTRWRPQAALQFVS